MIGIDIESLNVEKIQEIRIKINTKKGDLKWDSVLTQMKFLR